MINFVTHRPFSEKTEQKILFLKGPWKNAPKDSWLKISLLHDNMSLKWDYISLSDIT